MFGVSFLNYIFMLIKENTLSHSKVSYVQILGIMETAHV